jgi:DNA modification methylase
MGVAHNAAVTVDTWEGCYSSQWKGLCVPEAFAHPAKYSRSLIQRIYQHVREEGWLAPGDTVCDPFGGVGLGGLDAGLQGYRWIGVELEERFHELAQANIAFWQQRYGQLPQWKKPVCLQGDSRQLQTVLQGQADCCVSSPPYANGLGKEETYADHAKREKDSHRGIMQEKRIADPYYGSDPAQLGNLPPGSLDCALSSPPYANGCVHSGGTDPHPEHILGGEIRHVAYGQSAGQLGGMVAGELDGAISSPPWQDSDGRNGGSNIYERNQLQRGRNPENPSLHGHRTTTPYGTAMGQLGNIQSDTFWSAARAVVSQVYGVLRPGAAAIWVVKAYVRDSQLVDFPHQWQALCEAAGFVTVHEHHALLTTHHGTQADLFGADKEHTTKRVSFFRRLAEAKGSPVIDWETVLCMRKPLEGSVGMCDGAISSPPYADRCVNGNERFIHRNGIGNGHNEGDGATYGHTIGQLSSMPTGDVPTDGGGEA